MHRSHALKGTSVVWVLSLALPYLPMSFLQVCDDGSRVTLLGLGRVAVGIGVLKDVLC